MLSSHAQEQVVRFVRLWLVAFASSNALTSVSASKGAILSAAIAGLETAYREIHPATTAS